MQECLTGRNVSRSLRSQGLYRIQGSKPGQMDATSDPFFLDKFQRLCIAFTAVVRFRMLESSAVASFGIDMNPGHGVVLKGC